MSCVARLARPYSNRREVDYVYWARFYIRLHCLRYSAGLTADHVPAFLMHLAVDRNTAPATKHNALNVSTGRAARLKKSGPRTEL